MVNYNWRLQQNQSRGAQGLSRLCPHITSRPNVQMQISKLYYFHYYQMSQKISVSDPTICAAVFGIGLATPYVYRFLQAIAHRIKNPDNKLKTCIYAAIQMGGTNYNVAVATVILNSQGLIKDIIITRTNTDRVNDQNCDLTIQEIGRFLGDTLYDFIGVASFGPVCLDQTHVDFGNITSTPKLHWKNFPILNKVKQYTHAKAYGFDTDVNAPALAEFRLGGHHIQESLIYVTVGTGVGVGVVANGQTVHGLVHPEGGHIMYQIVYLESQDIHWKVKDFKNCLEGFVSNNAIAKRFGIQKTDVESIGDFEQVWQLIGYYLSQLCYNLTLIVSPEVIILGGGVMNRKAIFSHIYKEFPKLLNGYVKSPKLETANLHNYIRGTSIDHLALKGAMMLNPIGAESK